VIFNMTERDDVTFRALQPQGSSTASSLPPRSINRN
jgi:hypothetical protein